MSDAGQAGGRQRERRRAAQQAAVVAAVRSPGQVGRRQAAAVTVTVVPGGPVDGRGGRCGSGRITGRGRGGAGRVGLCGAARAKEFSGAAVRKSATRRSGRRRYGGVLGVGAVLQGSADT
ncbi:hypothetical protein [Streptomyces sp. NPDC001275]